MFRDPPVILLLLPFILVVKRSCVNAELKETEPPPIKTLFIPAATAV